MTHLIKDEDLNSKRGPCLMHAGLFSDVCHGQSVCMLSIVYLLYIEASIIPCLLPLDSTDPLDSLSSSVPDRPALL